MTAESAVIKICTCSICLEIFENPRTLDCEHSFCKECLEDHFDPALEPKGLRCPNCRKLHLLGQKDTISTIKTSIYVMQMLDAIKDSSPEDKKNLPNGRPCSLPPCLKCACQYCLECKKLYCKQHWLSEHDFSHKRSVALAYKRQNDCTVMMCEKHDSMIRDFCTSCHVFLCHYCKKNHSNCHVCSVKLLISRVKAPIQQHILQLTENIKTYATFVENFQVAVSESHDVWDNLQVSLQQAKSALITQFMDVLNSAEDNIKSCCLEAVSKFQEQMQRRIKDCCTLISKSEAALESANILISGNCDAEMLSQGPAIEKQIRSICVMLDKDMARNSDMPTCKIKFKPGSDLNLKGSLGDLEVYLNEGSNKFESMISLQPLNHCLSSSIESCFQPTLLADLIKEPFEVNRTDELESKSKKLPSSPSLVEGDENEDGKENDAPSSTIDIERTATANDVDVFLSGSSEENDTPSCGIDIEPQTTATETQAFFSGPSNDNNRHLFLGGVSSNETTLDELQNYFSQHCKIVSVRIFPNGGGLLIVDSEDAAQKLMETQTHWISDTEQVELSYFRPKKSVSVPSRDSRGDREQGVDRLASWRKHGQSPVGVDRLASWRKQGPPPVVSDASINREQIDAASMEADAEDNRDQVWRRSGMRNRGRGRGAGRSFTQYDRGEGRGASRSYMQLYRGEGRGASQSFARRRSALPGNEQWTTSRVRQPVQRINRSASESVLSEAHVDASERYCYRCGQSGHDAFDCFVDG